MNKCYMCQPDENRNAYLTRMARVINSIDNGVGLENEGNLKDTLSDAEKAEIKEYVFGALLEDVKRESNTRCKQAKFGRQESEDFYSIFQALVVEEFYKYNNSEYMADKEMQCTIGTYLHELSPRVMRIYLCESRGLKVNVIRNLSAVEKAIKAASRELDVSVYDVTADMIYDSLREKVHVSYDNTVKLMALLKGDESLDRMIEEDDPTLAQFSIEEVAYNDDELSPKVTEVLDKYFKKLSLTDMCLLMKEYGLFGDDALAMDIKDFVYLDFYQKFFMSDKSSRSKEDPVKSAYNKMLKINKMFKDIKAAFEEKGIGLAEFSNGLVKYCWCKWNTMNDTTL